MNCVIKFESNNGTIWEKEVESNYVCNALYCDNLIIFHDGTKFLVDKQRTELFDYLRSVK